MSNRKYPSRYEKLKKKRRVESLIQSQKGALNKFFISNKKDVNNSSEQTNLNELGDNEVIAEKIKENNNDEIYENVMVSEECQENNEKDKTGMDSRDLNNNLNQVSINIYDLGRWENIDNKFRDLLVEKGPIRENDINFPKDESSRHFSTSYYKRKLSNGEKHDRRWLVYSKDLDKVYCFCCKLFGVKSSVNQLGNEGTKDWKNLGTKLKSHETSDEHIINMNAWFELELKFLRNKTIDKDVQERIDKEKEHWRNVLIRIIGVVKNLAKNNLAFFENNEKLYQENNGIFKA